MNPDAIKPDNVSVQQPPSCQECRGHFSELLYASRGEPLEGRLAEGLAAHLRECRDCAGELRELLHAQSWLDVLNDDGAGATAGPPEGAPPVALYARLARLQRRRDAWRYAALAASAAVAVLLAALWWPGWGTAGRSAGVEANPITSAAAQPRDWGPEFQRLAQRLDEQDQVLRLLSAELRAAEGRQADRLADLEKRAGKAIRAADLDSLRFTALQHDIDELREFLTPRTRPAQQSAGGAD